MEWRSDGEGQQMEQDRLIDWRSDVNKTD